MNWLKQDSQAGRYSQIKGLSERRRLPRLGKIRLGELRANKSGKGEHPVELHYFRFDPENIQQYPAIRTLYGEKPTELDIMFPVDDPAIFFPQSLKVWGKTHGIKCRGDGETAVRNICLACFTKAGRKLTEAQINSGYGLDCRCENSPRYSLEIPCPCALLEAKSGLLCRQCANLMVILPRVSPAGIWQIDTGSGHSMIDVNSGIDYIRAMCGRVAWVPCKLRRVPKQTHEGGVAATHYPLQVVADFDAPTMRNVLAGTKPMEYFIEPPTDDEPLALSAPQAAEDTGAEGEGKPAGEGAANPGQQDNSAPALQDAPKEAGEKAPAPPETQPGQEHGAGEGRESLAPISQPQIDRIMALQKQGGYTAETWKAELAAFKVQSARDLTFGQADMFIKSLESKGKPAPQMPGDPPPACPKCKTMENVVEGKKAMTHKCTKCGTVIDE